MNKILTQDQLRDLTIADRMELIEDVWASLSNQPESLPVPDWHQQLLDERMAAHERDPTAAKSWDEVKVEILAALRK